MKELRQLEHGLAAKVVKRLAGTWPAIRRQAQQRRKEIIFT
jgi:hypothetical protein